MQQSPAIAAHIRRITMCAALLSAALQLPSLAAEDAAAPTHHGDGYRISDFRAPVPDSVEGGVTIDTARARDLFADGETLFIDVLPAPERPQGLAPTALWMPLPRYNIPGSIWLPNVGYGRLSDDLEDFFKTNLQRFSNGDLDKPMVIYCLANCWMSWNAARRAAAYGYTRVHWYPDGSDGWNADGLPLERSKPVMMDSR
jgi:PQQ-dependent catabolism-associated CXXCW motif protein